MGGQKCRNLISKKTTKGEGGVIKSEKWAEVVYGWPLKSLLFKFTKNREKNVTRILTLSFTCTK